MACPFFRRFLVRAILVCVVTAVLSCAAAVQGEVRINEFLASNELGILDEDGDASDWIELYNNGGPTTSLAGWSLTDDPSKPYKWTFPSISIAAGEFIVVFASGKNRKPTSGELHTNFRLDQDGEYLALYNGGVAVSGSEWTPSYPVQRTDFSYGKVVALSQFWFYDPPTPGVSNSTGTAYEGFAEQPVFSHDSGTFTSSFSLTLTSPTPGGTIRYTLDNSEPTGSSSLYSSPISISGITRVRARVYKTDYLPSDVRGRYYLRLASGIQSFESNMPIAVIDSAGVNIDEQGGERPFVTVSCAFIDTNEISGRATITDPADFGGRAGMHLRGASSAWFDKKQYRFETRNEEDEDKSVTLLGMPEESDYILHAPYSDKTLMRNFMAYWNYWSERMGNTGLRTRFFELFYNADGDSQVGFADYRGVYVLIEVIKQDKNRIDIAELAPGDNAEPEVSGGYVLKKDWHDSPGFTTAVYDDYLMYVDPEEPGLTTAQKNWIKAYCDEFEAALVGPDFTNPVTGYRKYIDVPSFIDNMIMVELSRNVDGYVLSTFYYKDRGGKITAGPVWDYNGSLGGANYFQSYELEGWHYENWEFPADNYNSWHWYERLLEDPEYLLQVADRWFDLREEKFATASLMQEIDDNAAYLTDNGAPDNAVDRNFCIPAEGENPEVPSDGPWNIDDNLWPNYYDDSHSNTVYMDYVNWMKTWITGRVAWLDDAYATQYSGGKPPILKIEGVEMNAGGPIDSGDALTIELPPGGSGTIYYTLDGEDPHEPAMPPTVVDSLALVEEDDTKAVLVPTAIDPLNYVDWRTDPGFDDSGWTDATYIGGRTGGVGYEKNSGYESNISYDVDATMYGVNTSCYIRIPFTASLSALGSFNQMTLRMRYDDGFVVYLNGSKIAEEYAPASPTWDSATSIDPFRETTVFVNYDVTGFMPALLDGDNVLAIHGLNLNTTSSDFLMSAELIAEEVSGGSGGGIAPTAVEYTGPEILTDTTVVKARILDGGDWSALNSATYSVGEIGGDLAITEIMYHPPDGDAEYIELQNIGAGTINLSGVHFTDGIEFTFPADTVLAPGEYIVLVRDSDVLAFGTLYPGVTIGGVYSGALNNGGEAVELTDTYGTVLVYLEYNDAAPWPTSPDGFGFSLVIIDPAGDPNDPYNWRASTNSGGSPGVSIPPPGVAAVVINEALTHTDLPAVDAIEIYNPTGGSADIRGWYLTDDRREPKKALIPSEPQYDIAAGGYAVITQDVFGDDPGPGMPGFYLNSHGEQVYIYSADGGGNLTGYSHGFRFGAAENDVSFGRHVSSDSREHFVAQSGKTLGSANAGPQIGPLVISEIYYHPVEGEIEYIELTNISGGTVNLWDDSSGGEPSNTYMVDGIGFAFDPATTIGAGETLIIVDMDNPRIDEPPAYGPFGEGSVLDSAGEAITLAWPDTPDFDYVPYVTMDEIEYDDESPWPNADGNGMALRRINNSAFGNDPANWEAVAPDYTPWGSPEVWVDFAFGGAELGTQTNPYDTLDEALTFVSLGGTVKIKSDSSITETSWTGVIDNPVRIEPFPAGSVRIGDVGGGSSGKEAAASRPVSATRTDSPGTSGGASGLIVSSGVAITSVSDGADSAAASGGPDATDGAIGIVTEAAGGSDSLEEEDVRFVPSASPAGLLVLAVAMAYAGLLTLLRRRTA